MDWSVWTSYYYDLPLDKALMEIRNMGLINVELSSEHMSEILIVIGKEKFADNRNKEIALKNVESSRYKTVSDIKDILSTLNISIIHGHGPFELESDLIITVDKWRNYVRNKLEQWYKIYSFLEIPTIVLHPITGDRVNDKRLLGINVEYLDIVGRLAENYGINIAVENMPSGLYSYIDEILGVIREVNRENIGVCVDTGHANIEAYRRKVYLAIEEAGTLLKATHIHDNDGTSDQHLFPGKGVIDWRKVFESLVKIDYRIPLNLEIPGEVRMPVDLRREKMIKFLRKYKDIMHL